MLLHHEIGELDGEKGCWGFAEGGMGSVSMAIAKSAKSHGADLFVNAVCCFYFLSVIKHTAVGKINST